MAAIICSTRESQDEWLAEFRKQAPDLDLRVWPDVGNIEDITHAIVSQPPLGALSSLPNLSHIHSLWAGIDHITRDPDWPTHIPVIRMVDYGLNQGMMEYMVGHTLRYHLNMPYFEAEQAAGRWSWQPPPLSENRSVGILGLGTLGQITAKHLLSLGFKVSGWSRSEKHIENVTSFAGEAGLESFLNQVEILICLLPNTPATKDLLDAKTLAMLPKGAAIINAGRGELINDADLVAALDSDHIRGATMDVFRAEPLPQDHAFWKHSNVTITPHVAAETRLSSGVTTVINNMLHLDGGGTLSELAGVMDIRAGY